MGQSANLAYTPVIATADGIIRTGASPGIGGFLVATGTPTLTLYDGTSTAGRKILDSLVCVAGTFYPFYAQLGAGLYADFTGSGSITFFV